MVEYIMKLAAIIAAIAAFIIACLKLLDALERLWDRLPEPLSKFLGYSIILIIPNAVIVWYFFYLAGSYPHRLNETGFFLAMVAQSTIGVSIYTYIWGKWLYPRLSHILSKSKPGSLKQENPASSDSETLEKSKSAKKPDPDLQKR